MFYDPNAPISQNDVIFEDNHLIAINKKPGQISQGDATGDDSLVEMVRTFIKKKYNKPGNVFCGLIHRLDRPVSGVILFAKTSKALERCNKMFQNKEFKKTYWALTNEAPREEQATLTNWLRKDNTTNKTKCFNKEVKYSKKASLDYELIGSLGGKYLLEIHPKTGRSHQIRSQLSYHHMPILNDVKYRGEEAHRERFIYLHSRSLSFVHPIKKEPVKITANTPPFQIWDLFRTIK